MFVAVLNGIKNKDGFNKISIWDREEASQRAIGNRMADYGLSVVHTSADALHDHKDTESRADAVVTIPRSYAYPGFMGRLQTHTLQVHDIMQDITPADSVVVVVS